MGALACAALSTSGCGGLDEDCDLTVTVDDVHIPRTRAEVGDTTVSLGDVALEAMVTDHDGDPAPYRRVSFTFDDGAVADVGAVTDTRGLARARLDRDDELFRRTLQDVSSYKAVVDVGLCSKPGSGAAAITFADDRDG